MAYELPNGQQLSLLRNRKQITIILTVATTKEDSISDLAHGLSGNLINAAVVTHQVGARVDAVLIEGVSLRTYDRAERRELRKSLKKEGR